MDTHKEIWVDVLTEEEAWLLFRKKARSVVNMSTTAPLAHEVVKECASLLLAIIVVVSAMRGKDNVLVWRNALRALREVTMEINGMEAQVFRPLWYNYEQLEDESIKQCFSYCSLYPEDWQIEKNELVDYWISEGLLGRVDSLDGFRNKGHALIEKLIDSCMIEKVPGDDDTVKLHDVIRDIATWICSSRECGRFIVAAGLGLKEARRVEQWKDAQRIIIDDE
ncbi:disease resistance protein At4g27190-like [Amborella trichopoda]|uniref:Disease resistance protein winged helix domain-containing protein n=1 Tax=Amborella trichopoda TaxID=13333 RepID=W1NQ66_AMBTC|nr:disease resistance protein At4g27190-like [Amborella trichopoda]ERM99051.1 hypothetical protein AMTR_s00101p00075070 [Amborella trichopoda]|eukprot:XP_020518550.1 disease resistance protein At4g27190-like [Amborella trichopoda]